MRHSMQEPLMGMHGLCVLYTSPHEHPVPMAVVAEGWTVRQTLGQAGKK